MIDYKESRRYSGFDSTSSFAMKSGQKAFHSCTSNPSEKPKPSPAVISYFKPTTVSSTSSLDSDRNAINGGKSENPNPWSAAPFSLTPTSSGTPIASLDPNRNAINDGKSKNPNLWPAAPSSLAPVISKTPTPQGAINISSRKYVSSVREAVAIFRQEYPEDSWPRAWSDRRIIYRLLENEVKAYVFLGLGNSRDRTLWLEDELESARRN